METFNANTIKGKWLEIRGEVQKAWGKLTNDELDQTKGDVKAISGLIQQKYGEEQDGYDKKVSEIVKRFDATKENVVSGVKDTLKQ